MIARSKFERAGQDFKQVIVRRHSSHRRRAWRTRRETHDAQQSIDDAEDDREEACIGERRGESEVESERAGNDVNQIVREAQVKSTEAGSDEADHTHQQKYNSQHRADLLCHNLKTFPVELLSLKECATIRTGVIYTSRKHRRAL